MRFSAGVIFFTSSCGDDWHLRGYDNAELRFRSTGCGLNETFTRYRTRCILLENRGSSMGLRG